MYLIIKATPFKLSTHTVIEQSSVRKATLGVQRYMVLDGSAKIVDTRDGGIQLGKFKHNRSICSYPLVSKTESRRMCDKCI